VAGRQGKTQIRRDVSIWLDNINSFAEIIERTILNCAYLQLLMNGDH
jgi:hypothetical protein